MNDNGDNDDNDDHGVGGIMMLAKMIMSNILPLVYHESQ